MSLKRQTTMNYFIIMYYDLFLNTELIRLHCSRHIRAWYQSINDFGKLSKINKDFFEKQSEQDQRFMWRFSAKTMSCFYSNLQITYSVWQHLFHLLPWSGEVQRLLQCSVTAKFICDTNYQPSMTSTDSSSASRTKRSVKLLQIIV